MSHRHGVELRRARQAGWRAVPLAAALLAASSAMASDVSGVYVTPGGTSTEALHLKSVNDEVVGRFVTKERTYLLEGWLDEPGYMGMMFDSEAPDQGLLYFVAAPVPEGLKFSLYAFSESGEMDLERPQRTLELKRAPGLKPKIPDELLASLNAGAMDAEETDIGEVESGQAGGPEPTATRSDPAPAGAAPQATPGAGAFHGPFHGVDSRGGQTLLNFAQQGERAQGELMAYGEVTRLEGAIKGNSIEGQLAASGATGTFKGTLVANRLDITCAVRSESGTGNLQFQFERGESKQMGERDPRLVGTWVKSSSYTSGDFSVASSQTCVIRADGTLTLFDSRMAGGGNAGSFDSGSSGGGVTSRWHTQANQLYINGQHYARFGFNDNTLGFWFSQNDKPEIWSRQ